MMIRRYMQTWMYRLPSKYNRHIVMIFDIMTAVYHKRGPKQYGVTENVMDLIFPSGLMQSLHLFAMMIPNPNV